MHSWTTEQVMQMAPDAGSAAAGRKLAVAGQWALLGRDEATLWGEIKGSGKEPYRTAIDPAGPAFKCSCPSRKFPCKHALALGLLYAGNQLPAGAAPNWVEEWHASREERERRRVEKVAKAGAPVDEETQARRAADQAKRAASREDRIAAGLAELRLWIGDLLRQGLAGPAAAGYRHWDTMAARLVDAQAPALARRIRRLGGQVNAGAGWQGPLLEGLATIHLLLEAHARAEGLPPPVAAELRSQLGHTLEKEEVLAGAGRRGEWRVLGSREEREEKLTLRRTWLWGAEHGFALLIDFAAGGQPLPPAPPVGLGLEATLCFYPGLPPQRALIREQHGPLPTRLPDCFGSIEAAAAAWAAALAANPWLERQPAALAAVRPYEFEGRWWLDDGAHRWPLAGGGLEPWVLCALGGGRPLPLFGEWDGHTFTPLAAFDAGGEPALLPAREAA